MACLRSSTKFSLGIGSSLQVARAKPVSSEVILGIKEVGRKIREKSAPDKVLESITRRNTNLQERTRVFDYFKEMAGNA